MKTRTRRSALGARNKHASLVYVRRGGDGAVGWRARLFGEDGHRKPQSYLLYLLSVIFARRMTSDLTTSSHKNEWL